MNLVSWNCRGMGSSLKLKAIKDLLNQEQPDILLIQETKITEQELQSSLKKSNIYEGTAVSAAGASGGLGTLWDKKKWKLKDYMQSRWWIRTDIQNIASTEEYTIYNVYAPPSLQRKSHVLGVNLI